MEKKINIMMWLSLLSNMFLTLMKVTVGILFQSQVLIADGIHNAGDVVASLAALGSVRIARRPADEDHPYGHGKAEILASGIVAFILGASALLTAYKSVETLFHELPEAHWIPFLAALFSLVLKLLLYVFSMRIGRAGRSKSLMATAYDHLADVYASLAAFAGIGVGLIGNYFHITILDYGDPVAGIIVSGLILKLAWEMTKDSMDALMEKNLEQEQLDFYSSIIRSIPHVNRIDRIRAREHGYYIIMDVRVGVPAHLTIQEGHDISRKIKQAIMSKDDSVREVLVHLNPWYDGYVDGQ